MASRFVSTGTIDPTSGLPVEGAEAPPGTAAASQPAIGEDRRNKEAWEAVQKEVEDERRKRREAEKETEGKSLYEILQENKAAKQAVFEEKAKLGNQFRALDDDEVEFLEDVRRSKRDEEERIRLETEEVLKAFREARKGDGAAAEGEGDGGGEVEDWGVGRKRKRREKEVKGLKRRVSSSAKDVEGRRESVEEGKAEGGKSVEAEMETAKAKMMPESDKNKKPAPKPKLGGLVDYGSDDESE